MTKALTGYFSLGRLTKSKSFEAKIKDLERQLSQVELALQQKDNDTYRRQHTTVRQLS